MKRSRLPVSVILFLGLSLLCLCGGWITMIFNAEGWLRYLIYGLFAGSFVFGFVALICFLSLRKKDRKEADAAIAQLQAYADGTVTSRDTGSASEPVADLAKAIDGLPSLVAQEEPIGDVLFGGEFEKRLDVALAKSASIRSCLILIALEKKATPQSHTKLRQAIVDAFPGRLCGEVRGGIAIYEPTALCQKEIEGQVKAFLAEFVAVENEASISPTSIGAKAALVFYPDYAADALLETAVAHIKEANPLIVLTTGKAELTPSTLGGQARKEEAAYEDFAIALSNTTDAKSRKKALRLFMIRNGLGLGYDQVGLALFDASRNAYRLVEELRQEGKTPAFKALAKDDLVAADRIDPYYNLAIGTRLCAVSDSIILPSRPAAILDSLGLRCIACQAVGTAERKIGFVYLTSNAAKAPLNPTEQASVKRFLLACEQYLLLENGFALEAEEKTRMRLLTENSLRYAYEIDPRTHRLLYLSENLAAAFPKAKLGAKCHKALLGLDAPCPKCPLVSDDSFKKALAPLGPGLLSFTALSKAPKAMISLSKQEHNLTSRRLDQALYILNRRALLADLERDLLDEKEGTVLLFTFENALMSAGKIKDGTVDDVMAAVLSRLSIASLDEGLYRYGDATLAYLLPGTNKDEAFAVAVQVAEEMANAVTLQDRDFVPEISYYIFSYPVEVNCTFDLESLMRTCSAKVANLGKGRVIPFDDGEAPLVLPRSYKEDALKKALSKGSFPLCYSLIRENSSLRPRYVEASIGVSLAKDERTSPKEVRSLIHEDRLLAKLEEGELASFFAAYKANRKTFKASSLSGVIFHVSKASLFSSTYMRTLSRGIKDAGVPKGFINLFFEGEILESEAEKLEAVKKTLSENNARLIGRYDGTQEGGIAYLGEYDLAQALSGRTAELALRERLAKAKASKTSLILPSLSKDEERSYAISLAIPYGQGSLYGEELEEEAFLKDIA